jgi:ABC-type Zn2+ transport system substrate-binding protein/surface adhesin
MVHVEYCDWPGVQRNQQRFLVDKNAQNLSSEGRLITVTITRAAPLLQKKCLPLRHAPPPRPNHNHHHNPNHNHNHNHYHNHNHDRTSPPPTHITTTPRFYLTHFSSAAHRCVYQIQSR